MQNRESYIFISLSVEQVSFALWIIFSDNEKTGTDNGAECRIPLDPPLLFKYLFLLTILYNILFNRLCD